MTPSGESSMEYVIIWTYRVAPEHENRFLDVYGPTGAWARLFGSAPSYRGTDLIRCEEPGRFMTIDRWESRIDYTRFQTEHAAEYAKFDAACETLTLAEECIAAGVFVA